VITLNLPSLENGCRLLGGVTLSATPLGGGLFHLSNRMMSLWADFVEKGSCCDAEISVIQSV
jgi:hypothetical protein